MNEVTSVTLANSAAVLATWPLVGRDDELALIAAALGRTTGPRSLVLAGPAGVGKSRLSLEALSAAAAAGAPTARVVASRAASTIPLGAIAPLLPDDEQLPDSRLGLLRRAATALAARATPDGGSLVLAVDDAHLLDDASATLVHQFAVEGSVRLLVTVRSGEPVPDAISALWKDGLAERLELAQLTRSEIEALAEDALEGPVDGALVQHLWTASEGNPLYLRELLIGAVERGAVKAEGRLWRLHGDFEAPPRLVELVEARLAGLTGQELEAFDLLAVAEGLGLATLESTVGGAAVEALERRALVSVTSDGRRRPVCLAHPLYGEVRRQTLPATRLRNGQRRLADLIESAGARRRDDILRVAILRLDADGSAAPALLAEAARLAWYTYDIVLEERLGRAAVEAGAGIASVLLLAEILRWAGRHQEAEEILEPVTPEEAGDDATFGEVCLTRAEVLFRGLDRHDDALAVVDRGLGRIQDPAWLDELWAERANIQVFAGDVIGGLEILEPLCERATGRALVAAAAVAVPALAIAGRVDEALELADRSFAVALELGRQPSMVDPAVFVIGRCLALGYAGRFEEAHAPAQFGYDWSVTTGIPAGRAWFGMILGLVAIGRGDLELASTRFEEAALGFRDQHDRSNSRWCWAGLALASALRGDAVRSRAALAEAEAAGMRSVGLLDVELERAEAALEAAEGDVDAAQRRLLAAADRARASGQQALEAAARHDLVRLGRVGGDVVERLTELAIGGGRLAEVRRDHALAVAAGDALPLVVVAAAYEEMGARLYAAEAAGQAAGLFERAGQRIRAEESAHRSRDLAANCGGARTPAIVPPAPSLGRLTPRERQVAKLAALGLPNREIAEQLFVSIRTVENQLQRAYTKLGVRRRSELRAALKRNE